MISVEFNLELGGTVTLFISGNVAVSKNPENGRVTVADGVHNNGGWKVTDPYDVVVQKIKAALWNDAVGKA